ncbi:MAG: NGG1p interacting factor NIF3, partial [Patescibacteria group bacterium]|nr:NGG1p interacting factor NIF3 [Patescibacteria group bacterium]
PYSDTKIHFNNRKKSIKKVLVGIDMSMGGLLLAKELGVDLVINHHPIGLALTGLDDVMDYQVDILEKYGVPVAIAEKMTHKRISEVTRGLSPANHYVTVDAARLLNINLINIHTPADNCVTKFVEEKIKKTKPRVVADVLKVLGDIKEYKEARRMGAGPMMFAGNAKNRCGKVVITEMTGGTSGSKEIYQAMANAGIGTIVGMHQSEEHRKEAEAAHLNVIIAGHISSDSIGMNIYLDELEKKGIEIIPFSGLIRVSRIKKKK